MATDSARSEDDDDCDEDVIWKGSPLHDYLAGQNDTEGLLELSVKRSTASTPESEVPLAPWPRPRPKTPRTGRKPSPRLVTEVAKCIVASELLVQEDENFVDSFILSDAIEHKQPTGQAQPSSSFSWLWGDAAFVSGSVAVAIAAGCSSLAMSLPCDRVRMSAAVAAALPAAIAVLMTSVKSRGEDQQVDLDEELLQSIQMLLSDMKLFKQIVKKSMNLLQGMELMQSGYMFAVNTSTGSTSTAAKTEEPWGSAPATPDAVFPTLRQATYKATVEVIVTYRSAVAQLMLVSPLEESLDHPDHYLAFVELANFGIPAQNPRLPPVSVRVLKDAVQLALVQQSEYLRRFSLAFCERVQDGGIPDGEAVLRHVGALVETLRKINKKLSLILEYHQALGIVPDDRQKSLVRRRQNRLELVPLRSVYTSLFSTGLHLQNSLLRVRQLESMFDAIQRSSASRPSEENLVLWLGGMQAIQQELSACVGCLDEGSSQIALIQAKDSNNRLPQLVAKVEEDAPADTKPAQFEDDFVPVRVSHEDEVENIDEVFEAVMDARARCQAGDEPRDTELFRRQKEEIELLKRQSESLMRELRCALVDKAKEHELRESVALQRTKLAVNNGHGANKPNSIQLPSSICNGELPSSSNSSSSVSSPSSDSDRKTVRSVSPDRRLSSSSNSSGKCSPKKFDSGEDEADGRGDLTDMYRSLSISDVSSPKPVKKAGQGSSASLLRSISSPDIKRALLAESSSPYVSLENLKNGRPAASGDLSDSDSSNAGSADELRYQVLKTYRRPLRPAALRAAEGSKTTPRTKRARNMTVALKSVGPVNSYVAKHCDISNPLFLPPKPPSCFDSGIAAQAAARARAAAAANGNGAKEDVFGSDSD